MHMDRCPLLPWVLAALALSTPDYALAEEPVLLSIRSRSRLSVQETARSAATDGRFKITLQVQLTDSSPGASDPSSDSDNPNEAARSFGSLSVSVAVTAVGSAGKQPRILSATTGPEGQATLTIPALDAGTYQVRATFLGDNLRDPASADLTIDLDRLPTQLQLTVPPRATRSEQLTLDLSLLGSHNRTARSEGLTATVTLAIGDLRKTLQMTNGHVAMPDFLRIPVKSLGSIHSGQVVTVLASFAGDRLYAPAQARKEIQLVSRTQISLASESPRPNTTEGAETAHGAPLVLTGQVQDEDGPLADEPVDIEASPSEGGASSGSAQSEPIPEAATSGANSGPEGSSTGRRTLGSGLTDASGRFRIVIPRLMLRPGTSLLSAQVWPRHSYLLPSRSAELPLTILPPEPVSLLYYVLPVLLSGGAVVLMLLGRWLAPRLRRLQAWLKAQWQAWLKARRLRNQQSGDSANMEPAADAADTTSSAGITLVSEQQAEPGVRLSQRLWLPALSLRRTVDATIDGQVLDATFGKAVPGATIKLSALSSAPAGGGAVATASQSAAITANAANSTQQEKEGIASTGTDSGIYRSVKCSENGRFVVSQLPAGRFLVQVFAPGYLPQQFPAHVPHRGELRGISVRLEPIRVRLLAEWRRVALRLVGSDTQVLTKTPREVLEQYQQHALATQSSGLSLLVVSGDQRRTALRTLRTLTELTEAAYYAPRDCTPEMLLAAVQLADTLASSLDEAQLTAQKEHAAAGPGGKVAMSLPPPAAQIRAPGAPRPLSQ